MHGIGLGIDPGKEPVRLEGLHEIADIDLTLDAPGLTLSDLLCISGELDDLMLPYTIDLSLLRHIKNLGLLRHIERVGKPL